MKIRIHGTAQGGFEDSIDIEEETLEEVRATAKIETEARNWSNCWSEEI